MFYIYMYNFLYVCLFYCIANDGDWVPAKISNRLFGDTKSKVYSVDLKNLKADTKYAFKISSGKKNLGKWMLLSSGKSRFGRPPF